MAIKVNGTTVIDDSRNLVNIASGAGSSTTYGDVGTYVTGVFLGTGLTEGTTKSGSSIFPAGMGDMGESSLPGNDAASGPGGNRYWSRGTTSLSGTWRVMGRMRYEDSNTRPRYMLWVRIS